MIPDRPWPVLVFGALVWLVMIVIAHKAVVRAGEHADELDRIAREQSAGDLPMTRPSYAQLARRTDAAMATVHLTMACPICSDPMAVRVDGASEVSIKRACADKCDDKNWFPWESFRDDAVAEAQGERQEHLTHLMDGAE